MNGFITSDRPILVSFDIDGTLIRSTGQANKLHREAFTHAFKHVFDVDTDIDVIKHHGGTDPLIILKVLMHHGVAKQEAQARLKDVEAAMLEYFAAHRQRAGDGLELLPGVRELLITLQADRRVITCLVTGNLEPIGWGKMEALGIADLFTTPRLGGFGSDYCSGNTEEMWRDRGELVRVAAERCSSIHGSAGQFKARFHVGDTPMDVQAALAAGAQAIGVTTGIYTREELQEFGKPPQVVVFDSLKDINRVLSVLGLS